MVNNYNMRRVGADRRRDSMPPERDSLDVFKPEPEGIVIPKIISRVKRKIKNGDFTSAKKNLGKIGLPFQRNIALGTFIKLISKEKNFSVDIHFLKKVFLMCLKMPS